jgi:hypothetical protein
MADKSAPTLSPERSQGSVALGSQMLRCAQHDRAVTQTKAWINVSMCIIGTDGWPGLFVKCHNRPRQLVGLFC